MEGSDIRRPYLSNRDGTKRHGGLRLLQAFDLVWGSYKEGMGVLEQIDSGIKAASKKVKAEKVIAHFQANTKHLRPVRLS